MTHDSKEGVAEGIINVLQNILRKNGIAPEEVGFIVHGTTQATNARLEGKQYREHSARSRQGAENFFTFVETADATSIPDEINRRIDELTNNGAQVIVATEAFGVDDATNETFVIKSARDKGLYATGGHEVSKLYSLKVRTRTAVVNGNLIPRMMETANMTESCVKHSGIPTSLMTIDEVRRRPILPLSRMTTGAPLPR